MQVSGWAFLASAIAWLNARQRRYLAAGMAVGAAVALRPTMLFWIVLLFIAGYRRIVISSLVTVGILFAAPILIYGQGLYRQWLSALNSDQHWISPVNIALIATLSRFGYRPFGIALAVAVAEWTAWRVHKIKPDFETTSGIGICLGILCAPLAWMNYVLFLAPFFMARRWNFLAWSAALLLLIRSVFSEPVFGLIYLVATVFVLAFFLSSNQPNIQLLVLKTSPEVRELLPERSAK